MTQLSCIWMLNNSDVKSLKRHAFFFVFFKLFFSIFKLIRDFFFLNSSFA